MMPVTHKQCLATIVLLALISLPVVAMAQDFPSNRVLAEQNVILAVKKFRFGGGVTSQKGNGMEVITYESAGSGFLVKRDGTFVTNYHVVNRAFEIEASFDDMGSQGGAAYRVPFIKVYNPRNDLAILQIQGSTSFNPAKLGNSDKVEPRHEVLAVGNPLNRGLNITDGKISQVQRDRNSRHPVMLVHTAQITSGNSGGSLYKGKEIVGVNVSVLLGPGQGQSGFNNAVPINLVKDLLDNPDYDRTLALTDIFDPSGDTLVRKIKQVVAYTKTAPAIEDKKPGRWSTTIRLDKLSDYLIALKTLDNVDMDIGIWQGDKLVGYGASNKPGAEFLAITNDYSREVRVGVLNYARQPAKFGLSIHKIVW